jgi:hypothetical protein
LFCNAYSEVFLAAEQGFSAVYTKVEFESAGLFKPPSASCSCLFGSSTAVAPFVKLKAVNMFYAATCTFVCLISVACDYAQLNEGLPSRLLRIWGISRLIFSTIMYPEVEFRDLVFSAELLAFCTCPLFEFVAARLRSRTLLRPIFRASFCASHCFISIVVCNYLRAWCCTVYAMELTCCVACSRSCSASVASVDLPANFSYFHSRKGVN